MLTPIRLPDAQLEHLAHVYLGLHLLERKGISFEEFLLATPQVREDACASWTWLRVQGDLDQARAIALRRGRHLLAEKLRTALARRASASERAEPQKERAHA